MMRDRWCMLVLAQCSPRLLLTGAVVTAMTAGVGVVLTFPEAAPSAPVLPSPNGAAPAPQAVPDPPPQASGSQIAGLAAPQASAPARPQRTRPQPAAPPPMAGSGDGLSEADWARLPPGLRQQVRLACENGYLTGAHCAHA